MAPDQVLEAALVEQKIERPAPCDQGAIGDNRIDIDRRDTEPVDLFLDLLGAQADFDIVLIAAGGSAGIADVLLDNLCERGYMVDRIGGGADIPALTGEAAEIGAARDGDGHKDRDRH